MAKVAAPTKASWAPIAPMLFLSKITSILSNNGQTWVTFQFVASGSPFVDDFYVDPTKHHWREDVASPPDRGRTFTLGRECGEPLSRRAPELPQ